MIALDPIVEWINFGVYLGLKEYFLRTIEVEQRGIIVNCKMVMLRQWLDNAEDTTKNHLYKTFLKYKFSHPRDVSF